MSLRSTPFTTFTFSDDDFSGRVDDPYGVAAYQIRTNRGVLGNLKSTTVTRAATSEVISEIHWGGLTSRRKGIIHGRDCGKLLGGATGGLNLLGSRKFYFRDEEEGSYYWKKEEASG